MFNADKNGNGRTEGACELPSADAPDPQVIPGTSEFGNRYTRAYKRKVLGESDACTKPGELGKYLRRIGLTHATLTCFRRQRAAGTLDAPAPVGRKAKSAAAPDQTRRLLELERENRKLKLKLEQAEAVIDVQKKVSRLLEISLGEGSGS